MQTINNRFKQLRQTLNYSQQEFAEKIGISRAHVSGIETEKDNPSTSLIKLVCMNFGVNEEWLREGTNQMFVIDKSFDMESVKSAISKYEVMKSILDQYIYNYKGDDIINVINSFSFFTSILTMKGLNDNRHTDYHQSFDNLMNIIESTTFKTYMLKETKSNNYKLLLKYKTALDETDSKILLEFKNMLSAYLREYSIDLEL